MAKARFTDEQLRAKLKKKIQSCQDRKIGFHLSMTEYEKLYRTRRCTYTGVLMDGNDGSPHYVTIDRINPDKPYIKGNVVACTTAANAAKNALFENPYTHKCTFKEVITLIETLIEMDFLPRPKTKSK